jgi:hypothetical protein
MVVFLSVDFSCARAVINWLPARTIANPRNKASGNQAVLLCKNSSTQGLTGVKFPDVFLKVLLVYLILIENSIRSA